MTAAPDTFTTWLDQAHIPEPRLTPDQRGVLLAAFHFRQSQGNDSYSTRLLTHFLLHCGTGLKVASLARLAGVSRPTASRQQALSSKQAVQQAHHRMDGRPYGKLLPRYAGPIAEFLFAHPDARRADVLDFIDRTWDVRVSRIALYHFLKKYGLDQLPGNDTAPGHPLGAEPATAPLPALPPSQTIPDIPAGRPVPSPAPPFSRPTRSSRVPSSSCRRR